MGVEELMASVVLGIEPVGAAAADACTIAGTSACRAALTVSILTSGASAITDVNTTPTRFHRISMQSSP
jgi:hypothetical protein